MTETAAPVAKRIEVTLHQAAQRFACLGLFLFLAAVALTAWPANLDCDTLYFVPPAGKAITPGTLLTALRFTPDDGNGFSGPVTVGDRIKLSVRRSARPEPAVNFLVGQSSTVHDLTVFLAAHAAAMTTPPAAPLRVTIDREGKGENYIINIEGTTAERRGLMLSLLRPRQSASAWLLAATFAALLLSLAAGAAAWHGHGEDGLSARREAIDLAIFAIVLLVPTLILMASPTAVAFLQSLGGSFG